MKKEKCPECGELTSDFEMYAKSYCCSNGHTFQQTKTAVRGILIVDATIVMFRLYNGDEITTGINTESMQDYVRICGKRLMVQPYDDGKINVRLD